MQNFINSCVVCLKNFSRKEPRRFQTGNLEEVSCTNQVLSVDTCGPFPPSGEGYRHVLSCIDEWSHKISLFPLRTRSADEIAKHIASVYLTDGPYLNIRHDCAKEYVSKIMQSVNALFNVQRIEIAPYSPRTNSRIEQMHAQLHKSMCACLRKYSQWHELLPFLADAYNSTPSTVLGTTPHYLHRGRHVPTYTSALLAIPQELNRTHGEFAARLASNIQIAYQCVTRTFGNQHWFRKIIITAIVQYHHLNFQIVFWFIRRGCRRIAQLNAFSWAILRHGINTSPVRLK